jgi:ATP-dependent Clp protease protease subunit
MSKTITQYRFNAAAANTAAPSPIDVEIFSEIVSENYWGGISANSFVSALKPYRGRPLNLKINSPGGSVFDGIAIYNFLKEWGADVNVTVEGICASIATVIALAGTKITMKLGTFWMVHNPSGLAYGTAKEVHETADILEKLAAGMLDIYAAHTGKSAAKIKSWMDEETWFSPAEALKAGFVHATSTATANATAFAGEKTFSNAPAAALALLKQFSTTGDSTAEKIVEKNEVETPESVRFVTASGEKPAATPAPDKNKKAANGEVCTVSGPNFTAQAEEKNTTQNTTNNQVERKPQMKIQLLTLLAAANISHQADTPDDEVIKSVFTASEFFNTLKKSNAEKDAEITALKGTLAARAAADAKATVEAAIQQGKLKPAAAAQWIADFTADATAAQARLDSIPTPPAPGEAPIPPGTDATAEASTSNPWKKETLNYSAQAKLRKENPDLAKKLQQEAGK